MKPEPFTWFAVTADQRRSRTGPDRVPEALDRLSALDPAPRLGFERTTGDEIQCLTAAAATVTAAVAILTRLGGWRIGIGCGPVDQPLPDSTRAARGGAYLAARAAVEAAASSPTQLAVRTIDSVGGVTYGETGDDPATAAQTALWLVRHAMEKRTEQGWELVELLASGMSNQQAATALGISPSAASQRGRVAATLIVTAGEHLATNLLAALQGAA